MSAGTFIAALQVTVDGHVLGPDGEAGWVDSWADGLGLLPPVDAFVLGGGMFPDYEQFWAAIADGADDVSQWLGRAPYERELEYARVAAATPHLVVSTTLRDVTWPTARIVRDLDELRAFKASAGTVYVVGGPGLVTSLVNAGLLDELRLIVHSVAVGTGRSLLGELLHAQELELLGSQPTTSGRVVLTYRLAEAARGWPATAAEARSTSA